VARSAPASGVRRHSLTLPSTRPWM
jgi:hypothetical protein